MLSLNNEILLSFGMLITKKSLINTQTKLMINIYFNNVCKRSMRRTAQHTILTATQKEGISSYCYKFIDEVINKTNKKEEILLNLSNFFKDESLGEFSLKQTIAKGFFPKFTFRKKDLLPLINTSGKLKVVNPLEKTDVRNFPEGIIGNQFAIQHDNVEGVLLNNENPSSFVAKSSFGGGNYIKDLTVILPSMNSFDLDVKCGNNAFTNTHLVLGSLLFLPDGNPYSVLCDHPTYDKINERRLKIFRGLPDENLAIFEALIKTPFDNFSKNSLIQNEMLKLISTGVIKRPPSFYASFKVIDHKINVLFYKKIEPHINTNNFNSKKDFEIFAKKALKAYYECVIEANRSKVFDKKLFEDTGFNQIDVENLFTEC